LGRNELLEDGAVAPGDAEELDPDLVLARALPLLPGDPAVGVQHLALARDRDRHERAEADRAVAHQHAASRADDPGPGESLRTVLAEDAQADGQLGWNARRAAGRVLGWHVSPPPGGAGLTHESSSILERTQDP